MKISVILITYNQEQYIRQAIESILMQRFNGEVVVIVADDCSIDKTFDIIKSFETISPFKFEYCDSKVNLGISKNYQRAFQACSGDYIAILEGDDYWTSPYHLQQHVDFLDVHRECSLSMNSVTILRDETNIFEPSEWVYPESIYYVGTREQIACGNKLGNLSACVLRHICVIKLPENLFEIPVADWMLGVMLSQHGLLGLLKEPTSIYRTNSNSQWASLNLKQRIDLQLKLAEQYDAFQNGKYHEYWEQLKKQLLQNNKFRWSDYLPPFLKIVIKLCIPPAFKYKFHVK